MPIAIGIYTEKGELIGYKADSFWTLDKEHAKLDELENGEIKPHLISNLEFILCRKTGIPLISPIAIHNCSRFHSYYETRLLGYREVPDGKPVFTHRIFEKEVQPLDDEDKARIEEVIKECSNVTW